MDASTIEKDLDISRGTSDCWVLCDCDGNISLCSSVAAEAGFSSGMSGADLISSSDVSEFEDIICAAKVGGETTALLTAAFHTGYLLARVKNSKLFSSPVVEIIFYKSRKEYLAASFEAEDGVGKVFSHIERSAENIGRLAREMENCDDEPELIRDKFSVITKKMDSFNVQREFVGYHMTNHPCCDDPIDASLLFDMIGRAFSERKTKPFRAEFVNPLSGFPVMCLADHDSYSGVILMSAAIAARLSEDNSCRLSFETDGDSVIIRASSPLRRGISLSDRSCDLKRLYALVPSNPIELMILESLSAEMEWNTDFHCDPKGNFTIRSVFIQGADPDRLKFRDGTLGAREAFARYSMYLEKSFLADTQQ